MKVFISLFLLTAVFFSFCSCSSYDPNQIVELEARIEALEDENRQLEDDLLSAEMKVEDLERYEEDYNLEKYSRDIFERIVDAADENCCIIVKGESVYHLIIDNCVDLDYGSKDELIVTTKKEAKANGYRLCNYCKEYQNFDWSAIERP